MALSSHLQELRKKHQHLSETVEMAQRHPATDALKIAELKKQKLKLMKRSRGFPKADLGLKRRFDMRWLGFPQAGPF